MDKNQILISETNQEGGGKVNRFTITEVAKLVGVSAKTIARWEKDGKVKKPKRDWRGWRVYEESDISHIKEFHETVFEA